MVSCPREVPCCVSYLKLTDILSSCGYTVITASNGEEALELFRKKQHKLSLLLTDVVMPGMGGRKLAEQITLEQPSIKTIYMSGYTDDAIVRHGILHDQVNFLQKPFLPLDLASKVHQVVNKKSSYLALLRIQMTADRLSD